jgi:ATP-dependent Clp protease ATP-binding subunit ClpC
MESTTQTILKTALQRAKDMNHGEIRCEHIMLSIIDGNCHAQDILTDMGVNLDEIGLKITEHLNTTVARDVSGNPSVTPKLSDDGWKIIDRAEKIAEEFGHNEIRSEHLLLSLIENNEYIAFLLTKVNINDLKEKIKTTTMSGPGRFSDTAEEIPGDNKQKTKTEQKSKTPILDNFSIDLCQAARNGDIDPVVGRVKEIERVAQILSRRRKNNPVLLGYQGVGKSAIVEGLAKNIVEGNCPQVLLDKRIVALSLTSLVAGTKYRGQFEERLKALIEEVKSHDDVIIFIDEIHTIIGAGNPSGNMDAANILKPALARGEFQCIGATTMDEYRESIESDGALERRFQKVIVDPPTPKETREIIEMLAPIYGEFHNVSFTPKALDLCVSLADRFITDRYFPDKALDILDEAGARCQIKCEIPENIKNLQDAIEKIRVEKEEAAKEQKFEEAARLRDSQASIQTRLNSEKKIWRAANKHNKVVVDEFKIREVVSMITNVPVEKCDVNDAKKYLELEQTLKKRIIFQDHALESISKAIRRSKTFISNQKKPQFSALLTGLSGVGKTETAKAIADEIFGPDSLVRLDMSEYQEAHTVSKMIGSPPGYVGYGEGGDLTEKVRRKPFCVVLFDEIEKAHPDVFNTMLQILDEGFLSDRQGRKVNFRNTIILMTSNIGVKQAIEHGAGVGFQTHGSLSKDLAMKSRIERTLRQKFPPEFLNRLNEIITFNSLNEDAIKTIIKLELDKLGNRITEAGHKFIWNENVIEYVFKDAYEPEYGARPIERAIQRLIEDPMSEELLKNEVKDGSTISVSYDETDKENPIKVVISSEVAVTEKPPKKKKETK